HTRSDRDWSSDVCSSDLGSSAAGSSGATRRRPAYGRITPTTVPRTTSVRLPERSATWTWALQGNSWMEWVTTDLPSRWVSSSHEIGRASGRGGGARWVGY